jgi:type VI secretion system ImpA family protein
MAIDLDALLAPVSDDAPAGPDMSYDAARQEIEAVFESSVSNDESGDSDVDWRGVIDRIVAQAGQTRDVWLAIYLMRAGAKSGRLDVVEDGASMLAGLFENLWPHVHPQLDEYGFQGRKGPCESLTRVSEFLKPMRNVVLLEHQRLGKYTGADFERFRLGGSDAEGYGMFRALLEETSDDDLNATVARIRGIGDAIKRADAVLVVNAGDDTGTNFTPTYAALDEIARGVESFLRVQVADGGDTAAEGSTGYDDRDSGGGPSLSGRVNSREDVIRALDAIAEYYGRKEPGSPVPYALRRARDWVTLDFLSVLEDIAPNSLDEARRVLVNGRNNESSGSWSDN